MAAQPETHAADRERELLGRMSQSVAGLTRTFHDPVTIWQIAHRLIDTHRYGGREQLPLNGRPGVSRPVTAWLRLCDGLVDAAALEAVGADAIHGRLLLLTLGRLDAEFGNWLRQTGLRRRLERSLGFTLTDVLVPWARPTRSVEFVELEQLPGHAGRLVDAAFSRDSRFLATVGYGGARVWHAQTGLPVGDPLDEERAVWRCAFSPDGRLLVTANQTGLVRVWDVPAGTQRAELPGLSDSPGGLVFSSDSSLLGGTGYDASVWLWELETGEARGGGPLEGHASSVAWCAFTPDDQLLISAGHDGEVRLWDVAGARPAGKPLIANDRSLGECALSPDGRLLAAPSTNGSTRVWDLDAGTLHSPPLDGRGPVRRCAFSPDGRILVTAGDAGVLQLWDVASGIQRGDDLAGHDGEIRWSEFSPDGRLLATAGADGSVRIWEVATGRPHGPPLAGHDAPVTRCRFSPNGERLATGDEDGVVRLWEPVDASATLASVIPDAIEGDDLLDLAADVEALANVIAARSTTPPLSIGLFGDWGAGKTFLIEEIQERVRQHARRARRSEAAGHCAHVRNIQFNAWHYADANLWASLVSHILDELARPEADANLSQSDAQAQLARLEEELASSSGVRERLERTRDHARRVEARKRLMRWTWGLAIDAESTKTLGALRRDAGTFRGSARLLLPTRRARAVVLGGALLVGVAIAAVLGVVGIDSAARIGAGLVATAGAFAGWVRIGATHVASLLERAGTTATVADLRRSDIDAELEAARTRERELRSELADLASGQRLARFAEERGASADYRSQLGLVSRIHDDFVRMSDILAAQSARIAEERSSDVQPIDETSVTGGGPLRRLLSRLTKRPIVEAAPATHELPVIDRIVLYIDDLDRCAPARVVEVLEAVHLILALPLFVVVVAVDPRWLLQSLRLHYSELLAGEPESNEAAFTDDGGQPLAARAWESTPLHYLEKIIQIPFALRPMGRTGVEALVAALLPVREQPEDVAGPRPQAAPNETQAPTPGSDDDRRDDGELPAQAVRVAAARRSLPSGLSPRPLLLTAAERDFAATVGCILRTPRAVKKFTNLYRLVRARIDEESGELDTFLESEDGDAADFQAVLILLAVVVAFPEEASAFLLGLGDLDPAADADTRPFSGYLIEIEQRPNGRWPDLVRFLRSVTTHDPPNATTRDPFRRWALEISRYSFASAQEIFTQYHAGRQTGTVDPAI